jgi:hypothetical protein
LVRPPANDPAAIVAELAERTRGAPPGTLVVLLPETSAGGLLGVFGGAKVDRAVRCAALLAHGCTDVGGGVDASSSLDLAWGRVR